MKVKNQFVSIHFQDTLWACNRRGIIAKISCNLHRSERLNLKTIFTCLSFHLQTIINHEGYQEDVIETVARYVTN